MEKINYCADDIELSSVIYKSTEVFATIRAMILKLDERVVSLEEKKMLSLFLGIRSTDNRINRMLSEFYGDLELVIEITKLKDSQSINIYEREFQAVMQLLKIQFGFEVFMLELLENPFILRLHEYYNYPIDAVKNRLSEAPDSKILTKTLQN
ncbi:MAG: hypothetical protein E7173_02935 [Firmicutes bacterium]|nr:hypothetical protein [Bacillota bacterium]